MNEEQWKGLGTLVLLLDEVMKMNSLGNQMVVCCTNLTRKHKSRHESAQSRSVDARMFVDVSG